jgi:predicted MPP superfamily phosphohydrolase
MPLIFIAIIVLFLGGNVYVFTKLLQSIPLFPLMAKWGIGLVYCLCALSLFGSFILKDNHLPFWLARTMYVVGSGWLVFTLYMVAALLLLSVLRLFNIHIRYEFLAALVVVLPILAYGYYNFTHPKTRVIDIPILVEGEKPMTIVGVSDLHLGYGMTKGRLKRYVDMINSHNPDVVLIAGDLIDNSVTPLYQTSMADELSELHAKYGIYMVPGNHEYISGMDKCERFLRDTPIKLLRDDIADLPNGVQVVGRDDRTNRRRKSITDLMALADKSRPTILLDHQPMELAEARNNGVSVQLSGHTHRGQIFPLSLVTDKIFEQSYGLTTDRTYIYVSSGLSLWGPPFRIGTDSELVVFNLTPRQR